MLIFGYESRLLSVRTTVCGYYLQAHSLFNLSNHTNSLLQVDGRVNVDALGARMDLLDITDNREQGRATLVAFVAIRMVDSLLAPLGITSS
jgi:hypothetical protein